MAEQDIISGVVWEWEDFIQSPMSYADCRLIFGDQGQGKSVTATACVVDDCYQYVSHIVSPDGEVINARALNDLEQARLEAPVDDGGMGMVYDNLSHMRIYNNDGTKSKIVAVPPDYIVLTPVKIFANRTLYGLRYAPFDVETMIEYINTPLMKNCWVLLSESVLINRKDTMSHMGRFMEWFGAECRKRHIRMVVDMQYRRMLQSIFHMYATTTVECSYDEDTSLVTLDVNKNSPVMSSTSYLSDRYRRFYKTDELMKIPQFKIDRALKSFSG